MSVFVSLSWGSQVTKKRRELLKIFEARIIQNWAGTSENGVKVFDKFEVLSVLWNMDFAGLMFRWGKHEDSGFAGFFISLNVEHTAYVLRDTLIRVSKKAWQKKEKEMRARWMMMTLQPETLSTFNICFYEIVQFMASRVCLRTGWWGLGGSKSYDLRTHTSTHEPRVLCASPPPGAAIRPAPRCAARPLHWVPGWPVLFSCF